MNPRTSTQATLSPRWLPVARLAWVAVAIVALGSFAISVPARYAELAHPAAGVRAALEGLGLSAGGYALYNVALDTIFVSAFATVAIVIFWHRSDEPVALLVAAMLVLWGPLNGLFVLTPDAIEGMQSLLQAALRSVLTYVGYITWMLFFYLFPSGRFVPPWTRWLALLYGVAFFGLWIFTPFGPLSWPPLLFGAAVLSVWGSFLGAQIYRYVRVSTRTERQQTKWVVFGVAVAVVGTMTTVFTIGAARDLAPRDVGPRMLSLLLMDVSALMIPLSIGIAMLRSRLFDIDVVINRTLVYGALTATVVGIYVLIVGALGALFRERGDLAVSLVATGVVAVVFAPIRERIQRAANRLMYGERDDPYAVLSRLGRRLEATLAPEAALETIVETIAQALKVPYVAIAIDRDGDGFTTVAEHGTPKEGGTVLPLVYQRENIGRLVVAPRAPGETFSPADRRLLEDLARQVEVAVHAYRLTADLQRSRERLVSAREEERRRLRRDLHDGLGPTLGALTLGLDTTRLALAQDDPKAVDALLLELKAQTQEAVSDVRRLVYGLRPPALDDLGLIPAIRQQAANRGILAEELPNGKAAQSVGKNGLAFRIEASDDLPPLPAAAEVACYRIAQEAMANAARHSGAGSCLVSLSVDAAAGTLELEVADDGTGISGERRAGVGMSSMRERAEELGGTLTVGALPEGGTRVLATLPLPATGEGE